MVGRVGILALQGNFQQHDIMLKKLGVNTIYVRYPQDLEKCDGLIIPGGESTTMSIQIDRNGLRKPIKNFSKNKSVFGTCAGMIMLSSKNINNIVKPLGLMNFSVNRNAWGRQVNSFSDTLSLDFDKKNDFEGVFIRAPKISSFGGNIKILASYNDEPVIITDGMHYVCSFHPEIGSDMRIHAYYLNQING